jgi:ankyrin repeat protein
MTKSFSIIKAYFLCCIILLSQNHSYASEFKTGNNHINKTSYQKKYCNKIETDVVDSKPNSNRDSEEVFNQLKSCIEADKSLLLRKDYIKGTLLHLAAFYNSFRAASYIISQAPELVNIKNDATKYDAQTPLHLAVQANGTGDKEKLIKLLIDNGANIRATDIYGRQPIHYACLNLDQIMNAGANDINVQDNVGNTILHLQTKDWVKNGISVNCVKEILKKNINTKIRNIDGYTALDLLERQKLNHKNEYLESSKEEVRKLLVNRKIY